MAEIDILSQFLVRIAYQQDEKSRKDFDQGLKQVQTHAAEFGAKIGELPVIVSEATKRISSSLSELWYAGQKTQASAEQIDALRRAATQSGEGADNAERSWNAFSETLRKFGDAAGRQLKQVFPDVSDYNPKDKFDAFLKAREEFSREYNAATDKEGKGRVLARGEAFGFGEESAVKGRQERFNAYFEKQLTRNAGLEGEKAAALTRAYNALADALETVARKADAAVFDKFGAVLDRLTKWLDEDSDRIVKFFTELVTQIGLVFTDLAKLSPAFVLLWDALKEVGAWLQKIIGKPDGSGLAGVRHLLELISGVVMTRFAISMVAGFVTAFAPLTALLVALGALGIIGVGAYAAGEAVRGWLGGGSAGGGFGPGEGTASGGRGATRRGRFGHGGAQGADGMGGHAGAGSGSPGKPNANFTAENAQALRESAARLGTTPEDLATVIGYETEGTFSPSKWGGAGGRYMGLIQFGPPERAQYGANENQTFKEQLGAVERYLKDRGFKPGMGINDLYSTILAGRPGLNRADSGGTVNQHVARMKGAMAARGRMFLKSGEPSAAPPPNIIPSQTDPHKPGFDWKSVPFHNFHHGMLQGKPLGSDQHSMNEIHDNRAVHNDVNIHVADASPRDLTARPLSRPKNADLIRNTSSYAA